MHWKHYCIQVLISFISLTASAAPVDSSAIFPIVPRHFKGPEVKFRQWLQGLKVDAPLDFETVLTEADGSSLFVVSVSNGSGIIGADIYVFNCGSERCDQLFFAERIVTRGHGAKGRLTVTLSKERREIVVKEDDGFVHASRRFRR